MSVLSKIESSVRPTILDLLKSKKSGVIIVAAVLALIAFFRQKNKRLQNALLRDKSLPREGKKKTRDGTINLSFFVHLFKLLKIAYPKFNSRITLDSFMMMVALVLRTVLSIYIAEVNGSFVRTIIERNLPDFALNILKMTVVSIPASVLNSFLEYTRKSISYQVRDNLCRHFHSLYVVEMRYYHVTNLDSRIANPDQRLTNDIEKFANSYAALYSNLTKPLLDVFMFGRALASRLGYLTVSYTFVWYFISGAIIKIVSPPMGLLTAIYQNAEGSYRSQHYNIKAFSPEIAFLNGARYEKNILKERFQTVYDAQTSILSKRLILGSFDDMLVKYGATIVGYYVLAKPSIDNFSSASAAKSMGQLTTDYIRNGSLMINLAKSIGRIVVSYKDMQAIAGYTMLLTQMQQVLDDLSENKFVRVQISERKGVNVDYRKNKSIAQTKTDKGVLRVVNDTISFNNVPLITPNGDHLVESVTFKLTQGQNVIISGPNGCGKSSLFRILGGLWPLMGGELERPNLKALFYLPQRPYLTDGTLLEQIIYPQCEYDISVNLNLAAELLNFVGLDFLLTSTNNETAFHVIKNWDEVLSGGQKQQIAMARLLYHKPCFAILDECTSTVSLKMEELFYNRARAEGITLLTISHRESLFQYHDLYLKFDGQGGYEIIDLQKNPHVVHTPNNDEDAEKSRKGSL